MINTFKKLDDAQVEPKQDLPFMCSVKDICQTTSVTNSLQKCPH